ncbi:MAG: agmatinase [Chitinophagaceae bacterium]
MVQLLGIPYDHNSSFLRGPALAPARIRLMDKEGSANAFAENGKEIKEVFTYNDAGDVVFEDIQPEKVFAAIKNKMRHLLQAGHQVMALGGDHSISYPVIDAYAEKYPGLHVLHLDAHTDLYDNFDNNPFSHASPFARLLETGKLGSLTQAGIRTATAHHHAQAKKYGVRMIEMKNIGVSFLEHLSAPLYISLDLDVLDPAFAPGVSHHEPGGLSTRELLNIIAQINLPLVGADIVEYNPVRDVNNMTAMVAYKLMKELISKMVQ